MLMTTGGFPKRFPLPLQRRKLFLLTKAAMVSMT